MYRTRTSKEKNRVSFIKKVIQASIFVGFFFHFVSSFSLNQNTDILEWTSSTNFMK